MPPSSAPRELILVAKPEIRLRAKAAGLFSETNTPTDSLAEILSAAGARIEPLFGISEDLVEFRVSSLAETLGVPPSRWSRFYKVTVPDERLPALARLLRSDPAVDAAFVKPGVELPLFRAGRSSLPAPAPDTVTQDFSDLQIYLGEPKKGVNAIAARKLAGGEGEGIQIIDIEGAWNFNHEDLVENQGGVVGGVRTPELEWRNHGTAVLGLLSGDRNALGITGICPRAHVRAVSVFGQPGSHSPTDAAPAAAIRQAADLLSAGDVMVLELHAPGPQVNFQSNENDKHGYIPVEWWPDNLTQIQAAVAKGIIVVEAAGNGFSNLDDPIFDINPTHPDHGPFPADWRNPFRVSNPGSGAIMVSAGAPPRLINNSNHGPDRSRLAFANFGERVDAQGWGAEVVTCGYGNIQQIDEDRFYTDNFDGTSSATPMVAGALASVQGMLRAAGQPLLTPARARKLLHDTGQEQQDADPEDNRPKSERIGKRPDIIAMAKKLGLVNQANEALDIGAAAASSPAKLTPS